MLMLLLLVLSCVTYEARDPDMPDPPSSSDDGQDDGGQDDEDNDEDTGRICKANRSQGPCSSSQRVDTGSN